MAVLFADVADSTRLYEVLGDTSAFSAVRDVITMLKTITTSCGGRVVKTIGDGLMCVFPSADDAANAASAMQMQIAQHPLLKNGNPLLIRAGFHFGPVIEDGTDVFGDSVNIAARISELALAGQVLTDSGTVAAISALRRRSTRPINSLPVKGKEREIEVHELVWQDSGESTMISGPPALATSAVNVNPGIRITYQGQERTFRNTIYFGREAAGNDVVVADPKASRRHAKIELRAGKFVLIDQSSNGTYVVVGAAGEIQLKREEVILYASGRFAFGHSTTEPDAEVIAFSCA